MNKFITKIVGAALGLTLAIGVGVAVGTGSKNAVEVKADSVSLAITGNQAVTVKVESSSTGDAVKAGQKINKGSSGTITVPKSVGSTTVYYHAVAWNKEGQDISLSCTSDNATLSKSAQSIEPNANVAGTATTFVIGDFSSYLFSVDVTQTSSTADMIITLTAASNKRFVLFDAYYEPATPDDPLSANPTLTCPSEVQIGKTISLSAEYTTTSGNAPDEIITCVSSDTSKLTVSGSETPWTLTGVATGSVTVTVAGSYSKKTSSVTVEVVEASSTVEDKVLSPDDINVTGESYATNNSATHKFEGVAYTTYQVQKNSGAFQFQKSNGYLQNNAVLHTVDETPAKIKAITLFMNSGNKTSDTTYGIPTVYEGTSAGPSTEVSVSGSYEVQGINTYVFSANMTYFKIAEEGGKGAMKIDTIIIELADGTSTALTKARTAAGHILSALSGKCGTGGTGVVTESDWSTLASQLATDLGDDSTAKTILKNADRVRIDNLSLGSALIESAMYRYDYCVSKFHFTPISDVTSASVAVIAQPTNSVSSTSTTTLVLIIISSISLVAVTGYFAIRRRREN